MGDRCVKSVKRTKKGSMLREETMKLTLMESYTLVTSVGNVSGLEIVYKFISIKTMLLIKLFQD